ncbi:MAG: HD domain-containing protein [Muribaculaceae bacterium]|nr:HD domain-containing protein [Muribaculaceae bacterium]
MSKRKYKIEFIDRVIDPVHGFIDITQVEKEIINLPIFKRLQSLKQLSLTNWVFPGAEHTRYMHSLGVMHIADLMAMNLRNLKGELKFDDSSRQLLRLAGLLHDIGHYPLSHVTEYVYNGNIKQDFEKISEYNENLRKSIEDEFSETSSGSTDYMKSRYSKPMHHETIGTKVIESDENIIRIIKKYCPFIDIDDIKDIIVGCVERNPEISSMVQLMHSELDADGIDYIMRDATFSGTSYGGFELGLLLRNLVVTTYNGVDVVGIKPKGISVVDQYLISKYFSYTQVILNKHVAIFDTMAEMFSKSLITLNKSIYPNATDLLQYIKNHNTNDEYLKFTDRAFWSQLDGLENKDLHNFVPKHIEAIHEKLRHYQEFDMIKETEFIITSNDFKHVYETLKSSPIFTKLTSQNNDSIVLFGKKGFTSEMPEDRFKAILSNIDNNLNDDKFSKFNLSRLQEGVAVIESDGSIRLLVDDARSIMSHLYDTNTYILREYKVG